MGVRSDLHFVPVEGETVPDSFLKKLALVALALFVMIPIGSVVVYAWWHELSFLNRRISGWGGLLGGVFAGIGLLALPFLVLGLFQRRRIVLGADKLQILKGETVTCQYPYRNIARMEYGKHEALGECVFIDFTDPADSDTLCPSTEKNKQTFGWHCALQSDSWKLRLPAIHAMLETHIRKAVPLA